MTAFLQAGTGAYDAQQQRAAGGGVRIAPEPINPYRAEIEEFGRAIREKRAPLHSAALGLQSQRVLAACYESARAGRVVDVL